MALADDTDPDALGVQGGGGRFWWLLGVLIAICAGISSSLGVNLQKLAHKRLKEAGGENGKFTRTGTWQCGLGLILLGSFADFAALSFAPQSLLAPLGSLSLVTNIMISPLLLAEKVNTKQRCSVAIIITGAVTSVIFASHTDTVYSAVQLFSFYGNAVFLFYFTFIIVYILSMLLLIRKVEQRDKNSPEYLKWRKLYRFSYPSISGVIGAAGVLFAKCVCELLVGTFQGNNLFAYWQSYFVMASFVLCMYLQIRWVNCALQRFEASYVVPVFSVFWILGSVISGLVFYREWVGMTTGQMIIFIIGVLLTVVGVVSLARKQINDDPSEDDVVTSQPLVDVSGLLDTDEDSDGVIESSLAHPEEFDAEHLVASI